MHAWEPYRPTAGNPWDLAKVGHLYRRAAFGATWDELQQGVKDGPAKTIDRLLNGSPADPDFQRTSDYMASERSMPANTPGTQLAAWWLSRAGRRVAVLEAQRVAGGATGRSTGFLTLGGLRPFHALAGAVGEERALRLWELSLENQRLLRREETLPTARCGRNTPSRRMCPRVPHTRERSLRRARLRVQNGRGRGADCRRRNCSSDTGRGDIPDTRRD